MSDSLKRDDWPIAVQVAEDDLSPAARLLDEFNREFDDLSPGPETLERRLVELLEGGDTDVILGGRGPEGIAVIRYRLSIWCPGPEAYLAELFVRPDTRGQGLGHALIEAVLERARGRGASYIDLATSVDDTEARALYESFGFTNNEGDPDGPSMLYYEREL